MKMSQEWYEEEEEDLVEIYKVWCKMPFWTAFESSALIHQCDPSEPIEIPSAQRVVHRLRTLIERHCGTELLAGSPDKISPPTLLLWAKRTGVRINYPLKACITRSYPEARKRPDPALSREALLARVAELEADVQKLADDPPPNFKERQSLMKLVLGMAVAGYGYNPRAPRNPATGEIINDLRIKEVPTVDQGTLLRCLRTAMEELDWPPPEEDGGQSKVSPAKPPSRKRPQAGR